VQCCPRDLKQERCTRARVWPGMVHAAAALVFHIVCHATNVICRPPMQNGNATHGQSVPTRGGGGVFDVRSHWCIRCWWQRTCKKKNVPTTSTALPWTSSSWSRSVHVRLEQTPACIARGVVRARCGCREWSCGRPCHSMCFSSARCFLWEHACTS
jgi:hypothetical protein